MAGIIKGLVRYSVIGALLFGGVALLAGPHRVAALYDQARFSLAKAIDDNIDDPILLRRELQRLQEKYPERVESVRSDLAAVAQDIAELEHDTQVAVRTVALVSQDITRMDELVKLAEAKQNTGVHYVAIRYNGHKMPLAEAYSKSAKLDTTRDFYTQRSDDNRRHLEYLRQQEERLIDLLTQLETEQAQFTSQLWQLDNQIAAIARNERLIETMKDRERRYDWNNEREVVSLDQLNAKLAELREKQEHQLAQLAQQQESISYWDKARVQVGAEGVGETVIVPEYEPMEEAVIEFDSEVLELEASNGPLAWNN